MAGKSRTKRSVPVASAPVAALADAAAGPELATMLASLNLKELTGFETVLVLKARNRLSNHDRGMLLVTIGEVMLRKDPGLGCPDYDKLPAAARDGWDEVGANEVRAALMLTRRSANTLAGLARDLIERLPAVLQAMIDGVLDQPRARIFSEHTSLRSPTHAHAVVAALLPKAPKLTTAQLIDAIAKAAIELDPDWARRRYERALRGRRVEGVIGPDGTASLSGYQLPADQVAVACDRLDAIARQLKRAGHPHPINHIRADIFLGKLTGAYAAMDDEQLLAHLLATMPAPADTGAQADSDTPADSGAQSDAADPATGHPHPGTATSTNATSSEKDSNDSSGSRNDGSGRGSGHGDDPSGGDDDGDGPDGPFGSDDDDPDGDGPDGPFGSDDDDPDGDGPDGSDDDPGPDGPDRPDGDPECPDGPYGSDDGGPDDPDTPDGDRDPPDVAGAMAETDTDSEAATAGTIAATSTVETANAVIASPGPSPPHAGADPPDNDGATGADPPDDDGAAGASDGRIGDGRCPGGDDGHADDDGNADDDGRNDGGRNDRAGNGNGSNDGGNGDYDGRGVVRGRGLRLLTGLGTIAGVDRHASHLLGWGPMHAELARTLSSTPHASWWYVLVEPDGTPLDVGPIRRRPTQPWAPGPPNTTMDTPPATHTRTGPGTPGTARPARPGRRHATVLNPASATNQPEHGRPPCATTTPSRRSPPGSSPSPTNAASPAF